MAINAYVFDSNSVSCNINLEYLPRIGDTMYMEETGMTYVVEDVIHRVNSGSVKNIGIKVNWR